VQKTRRKGSAIPLLLLIAALIGAAPIAAARPKFYVKTSWLAW
jgi:hypothetical protein